MNGWKEKRKERCRERNKKERETRRSKGDDEKRTLGTEGRDKSTTGKLYSNHKKP